MVKAGPRGARRGPSACWGEKLWICCWSATWRAHEGSSVGHHPRSTAIAHDRMGPALALVARRRGAGSFTPHRPDLALGPRGSFTPAGCCAAVGCPLSAVGCLPSAACCPLPAVGCPIRPTILSRDPLLSTSRKHGAVAQLGERLDRTQEARGSSPLSSTPSLSRCLGGEAGKLQVGKLQVLAACPPAACPLLLYKGIAEVAAPWCNWQHA